MESSKNLIVGKTIWCLLFKIVGFISLSTKRARVSSALVFPGFTQLVAPEVLFVVVVVTFFFFFFLSPLPPTPKRIKGNTFKELILECGVY